MACKLFMDLPDGVKMPALGFGTWQAADAELEAALEAALEAGYRHIDCAYAYENEGVIGRVLERWIESGKGSRDDLFIVTKLPPVGNRPSSMRKYLQRSLDRLRLKYVDLYLVHTPFGFQERGEEAHPFDEDGQILIEMTTDHVAVWREMEKAVEDGLTRTIGVSNFNQRQLERLQAEVKIPIANLQVELHVYLQQAELLRWCRDHKVSVTAYAPLGSRGIGALLQKAGIHKEVPDLLANPTVGVVALKHGVSQAQVLLRYLLQLGVAAIPKSTTPARIRVNIDLFEFKLDDEDMKLLAELDQGPSARVCDFSFFKGLQKHPEFPF